MIITIVILSLVLLGSIIFNVLGDKANRQLYAENRTLKYEQSNLLNAAEDALPTYVAMRYVFYNGNALTWAVYRISKQNGKGYNTLIKAFYDEDDDFNRREAEELCEILNSK